MGLLLLYIVNDRVAPLKAKGLLHSSFQHQLHQLRQHHQNCPCWQTLGPSIQSISRHHVRKNHTHCLQGINPRQGSLNTQNNQIPAFGKSSFAIRKRCKLTNNHVFGVEERIYWEHWVFMARDRGSSWAKSRLGRAALQDHLYIQLWDREGKGFSWYDIENGLELWSEERKGGVPGFQAEGSGFRKKHQINGRLGTLLSVHQYGHSGSAFLRLSV